MTESASSAALRLSLFYAALFTVVGLHLPYWPVWLKAQGVGPEAVGLLMAAKFWVKPLANPIVTEIVDRTGRRRMTMLVLAFGTLVCFALFTLADGFWSLLGLSLLTGLFFSAMIPLGENLAILTAYRHDLDYGRLRLWGSLAFIATSTAGGALLAIMSAEIVLGGLILSLGVLVFACGFLPKPGQRADRIVALPVSVLLKNRRYWIFIAATALGSAAHMTYYGFASIHWQSSGIDDRVIGLLWAEGVLAEVVLFAFSGRVVGWIGPVGLLLVGAAGGVLRWTLLGATTDLAVLFPANALHALTFGAAHLGSMHFMTRKFPPSLSARTQGVYSAVVMGIVPGIAVYAAGYLYNALQGAAFFVSSLLALGGVAFVLILARLEKTNALPDFTSERAPERVSKPSVSKPPSVAAEE